MLSHYPNVRPTAVETRLQYGKFVEMFTPYDESIERKMGIGNRATKRRGRFEKRRRLGRRRNAAHPTNLIPVTFEPL